MATEASFDRCPTCHQHFDLDQRTPKLLPCQHTVCMACLGGLGRTKRGGGVGRRRKLTCPDCKKTQRVPSRGAGLGALPDNVTLIRYLQGRQAGGGGESPYSPSSPAQGAPRAGVDPRADLVALVSRLGTALETLERPLAERPPSARGGDSPGIPPDVINAVTQEMKAVFDKLRGELEQRRARLLAELHGEAAAKYRVLTAAQQRKTADAVKNLFDEGRYLLKARSVLDPSAVSDLVARSACIRTDPASLMALCKPVEVLLSYDATVHDVISNVGHIEVKRDESDVTSGSASPEAGSGSSPLSRAAGLLRRGSLRLTRRRSRSFSGRGPSSGVNTSPPVRPPPPQPHPVEGRPTSPQPGVVGGSITQRSVPSPIGDKYPVPSTQTGSLVYPRLHGDAGTSPVDGVARSSTPTAPAAAPSPQWSPAGTPHRPGWRDTVQPRSPESYAASSHDLRDRQRPTPAPRGLNTGAVIPGDPVGPGRVDPGPGTVTGRVPGTGAATPQGGPTATVAQLIDSLVKLKIVDHVVSRPLGLRFGPYDVTCIGQSGQAAGCFSAPCAVMVTPFHGRQSLLVADTLNNRLQRMRVDGSMLATYVELSGRKLHLPASLAGTLDGHVIITDAGHTRIRLMTQTGEERLGFGRQGADKGGFRCPWGVATDSRGQMYITDLINDHVQVFDQFGNYTRTLGGPGCLPGRLAHPRGVAARQNKIVLSDTENHRLQVLNPEGKALLTIGSPGRGPGQFRFPAGLALDGSGNILVADSGNHRIQVLTLEGRFVGQFGEQGSLPGQFLNPQDVTMTTDGTLIVADTGNDRLQVIRRSGRTIPLY